MSLARLASGRIAGQSMRLSLGTLRQRISSPQSLAPTFAEPVPCSSTGLVLSRFLSLGTTQMRRKARISAPLAQALLLHRAQERGLALLTRGQAGRIASQSALRTTKRHASLGLVGSLIVLSRRIILYPTLIVGGIGAAAGKVKESMQVELPPGLDELSTGVGSFFDALRGEVDFIRDSMTPNRAKDTTNLQQSAMEVGAANATVVGTGLQNAATAATSGTSNNGNKDDDDKGLDAVTEAKIKQLQAALKLSEDQVSDLKKEILRLKQEHETEVALLNERLQEVETKLTTAQDDAQRMLLQERERLQKIIDDLTTQNEEINRLHILKSQKNANLEKEKRAIDLFADILALRSKADTSFNAYEHLPRVVVVGDQSAGKTSVLEMLVKARIFPRGAGSMMTRSPIQVTVSEGPHHVCSFHNENTVYNLRSERDLKHLRDAIEERMMNTLTGGAVVSNQTISLNLKGPGLQPMVLVDLPGVIQHHTVGMPSSTKGSILEMCQKHIENPNAIILCIQDASRDAESSSVADLVRLADPEGDRTVFVLTKADLAEKIGISREKMIATLQGRRFNMHARSYFAVITGTANPNDSLDVIRKTERDYFATSDLFTKTEGLSQERLGVENLSRTVSDIFWERVRSTIATEQMNVSTALKSKENEWKNTYPNEARLSRDDLFNIGRHQILQNVTAFNDTMTPTQWEAVLRDQIWTRIREFVIDEIYINSADTTLPEFKTRVENLLYSWVGNDLPRLSVNAAKDTLMGEFMKVLTARDDVFSPLMEAVRNECSSDFQWNPNSVAKIRSVQELMLRDTVVQSAAEWDAAVQFMRHTLMQELGDATRSLKEKEGPSSLMQWVKWQRLTQEQRLHRAIMEELKPYFKQSKHAKEPHKPSLSSQEVQACIHSITKKTRLTASQREIEETYNLLYKNAFLQSAVKSAVYCSTKYTGGEVTRSPNGLHCADVVLFWRVHKMLRATVSMLRIEAMEYRLEIQEDIRKVLNDIDKDPSKKQTLIKGKRVTLSEEIEVLRLLQRKMDAFKQQCKKEGRIR